ncbi:recombinase family protein [Streptomyces sp. GS7]|uniref:recombinase family protein n=1 Tax=Streptomyces sp. GS7 TaxID=2692234 RepID=UPI001F38EC0D|nr:recombinase family protein [Streptomyces sp. GS7]
MQPTHASPRPQGDAQRQWQTRPYRLDGILAPLRLFINRSLHELVSTGVELSKGPVQPVHQTVHLPLPFKNPCQPFDEFGGCRALIGLVRVSTDKQNVDRQHDALDPICVKVFEEKVSGKPAVDERPGLSAALDYLRDGDMLAVQEVDRLGREASP